MANFGDFRPLLDSIKAELKAIARNTSNQRSGTFTTSGGVGTSVPSGARNLSITKTNGTGTVNITMSDGSVYPLTAQSEVFKTYAPHGSHLPAYNIATSDGGTWKWTTVK